jgi:predicted  nucleic acid-binding Zn-ribbon protein
MANEKILISGIEYKIRKLIDENVHLKKENQELNDRINSLSGQLKELNEELENYKTKLFKYTLANTLEIEYGVEEGKKRIDDLIEEIDRCIDVLSS